ncbi:DUF4157 domain-containing protein [Ruegeria sp. HKCCD8929]|uniref:eCIS core domain-containing protein n=1 Tax=Ruegeria sp. HKCCD8929 TaxID=2683006 RepID=UPI0014895D3D|nr:DUF4157 domain-containing protein [Ruegeria sp. HKCCD8929]
MAERAHTIDVAPAKSATAPVTTGLLQRACSCGGTPGPSGQCSACAAEDKLGGQTRLTIGPPNDTFEQEADRVAARVTSGQDAGAISTLGRGGLQRQMGGEEEEEMQLQRQSEEEEELQLQRQEEEEEVQAKPFGSRANSPRATGFAGRLSAESATGRPLDAATRSAFEPRFGFDLSHVRLHDGAGAHRLSRDIGARAFTHRNDIYFAAGQLSPNTTRGRRLLAHEITHTFQQGGDTVRRKVSGKSKCPASIHKAPKKPLDALATLDKRAAHLAQGTANVFELQALLHGDPTLRTGSVVKAYEERFGTAPKKGKRWKSRFRKKTFKKEVDAVIHEMARVSTNYERIAKWFGGNVRYRCPGTKSYAIPGCAAGPCGSSYAESCPGSRHMGICPNFWTMPSEDARAATLVHEAVHARLKYSGHSTRTLNRRIRNPECYEAVVSDIYGLNLTTFTCPKV